jgi:hypothetical protein
MTFLARNESSAPISEPCSPFWQTNMPVFTIIHESIEICHVQTHILVAISLRQTLAVIGFWITGGT